MSAYPNTGSLFPMDEKYRKEKSPNLTGKIELGEDLCNYIAKEYKAGGEVILDISAWTRTGADSGKKFLSLAVKEHYIKQGETKTTNVVDEDIPF